MPRRKMYSEAEAYALMQASENHNSPTSGQPGHTMKQHVGGTSAQTSNRLMASVSSVPGAPLIMGPTGAMLDKASTLAVYKAKTPGLSTAAAKKAYDSMFEPGKKNVGAFLDQQQAARALAFALNHADGQTALGKIDAGSKREFFVVAMGAWTIAGRPDARKMYCASLSTAQDPTSDIPHMADFASVTVGLDALAPDSLHLQTFYPMA